MNAKVIALKDRARSARTSGDSIRVERFDTNVLLTVADVEAVLTPAEAKLLGEHLTVLAIVLDGGAQ